MRHGKKWENVIHNQEKNTNDSIIGISRQGCLNNYYKHIKNLQEKVNIMEENMGYLEKKKENRVKTVD